MPYGVLAKMKKEITKIIFIIIIIKILRADNFHLKPKYNRGMIQKIINIANATLESISYGWGILIKLVNSGNIIKYSIDITMRVMNLIISEKDYLNKLFISE